MRTNGNISPRELYPNLSRLQISEESRLSDWEPNSDRTAESPKPRNGSLVEQFEDSQKSISLVDFQSWFILQSGPGSDTCLDVLKALNPPRQREAEATPPLSPSHYFSADES
ncbi:MAG: hypothetical protein ACI9BD_001010 [Candidatus Marinamargulisbacteria bacterium]|jgi:hypothetical protein